MFDSSFKLSKIYFTALQVLRVASEWIDESMEDMVQVCKQGKLRIMYVLGIESEDRENVLRNSDKLTEIIKKEEKRLPWRAEKKV